MKNANSEILEYLPSSFNKKWYYIKNRNETSFLNKNLLGKAFFLKKREHFQLLMMLN